jgi:hypothetical protein
MKKPAGRTPIACSQAVRREVAFTCPDNTTGEQSRGQKDRKGQNEIQITFPCTMHQFQAYVKPTGSRSIRYREDYGQQ